MIPCSSIIATKRYCGTAWCVMLADFGVYFAIVEMTEFESVMLVTAKDQIAEWHGKAA